MDQIVIENLRIYAHHGVYREENEKGQNFYTQCGIGDGYKECGAVG